jgi:hypothetical protein
MRDKITDMLETALMGFLFGFGFTGAVVIWSIILP